MVEIEEHEVGKVSPVAVWVMWSVCEMELEQCAKLSEKWVPLELQKLVEWCAR
jgi:hypothetical protein